MGLFIVSSTLAPEYLLNLLLLQQNVLIKKIFLAETLDLLRP